MPERVAFIGLGVMGEPMAAHLARSGHDVAVFNRSRDKAEAWAKTNHGRVAATPAEAARGARFVACCVTGDSASRDMCSGPDGAFGAMSPGSVFVDHSTTGAETAQDNAAAASAKGIGYLDAPVIGAVEGAKQGKLLALVGGEAAAVATATPYLRAYTRVVRHMGSSGHGQLTKMVNAIIQAPIIEGLSEALDFAFKAGLETEKLLEALGEHEGRSWWFSMRGLAMGAKLREGLHPKHGRQGLLIKDLGICLAETKARGFGLPVTGLIAQLPAGGRTGGSAPGGDE
ncbi:MAG: NAD(P)-dependent oxidoreductase [Rhodospirillales bacterium]|nr:NAD(P)-dependent oxidoreductase [Rhodospirillales bacterium]